MSKSTLTVAVSIPVTDTGMVVVGNLSSLGVAVSPVVVGETVGDRERVDAVWRLSSEADAVFRGEKTVEEGVREFLNLVGVTETDL